MFARRSLRQLHIDPLSSPDSPDRTDSDLEDEVKEAAPQLLSLSAVVPVLPDQPAAAAAAALAADAAAVAPAAAAAVAVAAAARRRGRYNIMSDERRGMALELMLSQRMSVAQVARTLGSSVSKATLYSLRRSFLKTSRAERKRKGGSQAKYTVRDAEVLCTIQDEHHDWTYPQLRDEWRLRTGKAAMRLSDGTINRMLKGGKFSTKQLYHEPASRNTPANIEARRAYALSASTWLDSEVVYIDEAGFNLHLTRRRGRSRIGERATIETVNSRGGNISICAAISPTLGVLHYKIRLGAFNSEEFVAFLR